MSSSSGAATATTTTNVFQIGKYPTKLKKVECTTKSSPPVPLPKPLLIAMPNETGEFPLLLCLHGFVLFNSFYSQLIQHIASHGFIVIVPQLNTVTEVPHTSDEIKSAAATANWLSKGLHDVLPPNIKPNLSKVGLAGHSRGGKVAFALALSKEIKNLKLSALIGIDPVDGTEKGKQSPPQVLTYVPRSFKLDMAVMVIGSALGEEKNMFVIPPCAPKGVNHEDFFKECQKPACYFVAKDYGHLDMLDDDTTNIAKGFVEWLMGISTHIVSAKGKSREPMRRFVGGIVVAFMRAYLEGEVGDFMAIKDGLVKTPVELRNVEILE